MIARLDIQVASRLGTSYLKESYFSPPFKLANITENRNQKCLHLMQMSSSPGILDRDQFEIKIELEENCHLRLHTQSYQRLFSMKAGASQAVEIHMDKGSSFTYLPHPIVPQESAIFKSINRIFLSEGCHLIWGEIVTCGRKLNGEVFRFSKFHSITEIFRNGRLKIKENICLIPEFMNLHGIGQLEGFTHQASLIVIDNEIDPEKSVHAANAFLASQEDVIYGVTIAPGSGILVRILGNKSEQLMDVLNMTAITIKAQKVNYAY